MIPMINGRGEYGRAAGLYFTLYMSQMLYAGQSSREIVTFFSDF